MLMGRALAAKKDVSCTDLNTYIDFYLGDKDSYLKSRTKNCELLWLRLDFFRKHAWADSLLNSLVLTRSNKTTYITSDRSFCRDTFPVSIAFDVEKIQWISS